MNSQNNSAEMALYPIKEVKQLYLTKLAYETTLTELQALATSNKELEQLVNQLQLENEALRLQLESSANFKT